MQLVEQGRIGLQDLLSEYLPEFASVRVADGYEPGDFRNIPDLNAPSHRAERPILIENLLSMTAGLSYDTASEPIAKLREKSGNTAGTVETVSYTHLNRFHAADHLIRLSDHLLTINSFNRSPYPESAEQK